MPSLDTPCYDDTTVWTSIFPYYRPQIAPPPCMHTAAVAPHVPAVIMPSHHQGEHEQTSLFYYQPYLLVSWTSFLILLVTHFVCTWSSLSVFLIIPPSVLDYPPSVLDHSS